MECFYALGRQHWGRGLATEAAQALVDYAFSKLGLKRIVAFVTAENGASARVAEKAGFMYQGMVHNEQFGHEVRKYGITSGRFHE